MTWFAVRAGQPIERGLTAAYALVAAGGLVMSWWFLRNCRGADVAAGRSDGFHTAEAQP
jgi:hypothetical protein